MTSKLEKGGHLWVLNPDAEGEMSKRLSYAVPAKIAARIRERKGLFEPLISAEPSVFAFDLQRNQYADRETRALIWCPTPYAQSQAQTAGLQLTDAPSMEILKACHNKCFISEKLSDYTLPGRTIIRSRVAWEHYRRTNTGDLRLKRPFGYAGKGQRLWPQEGSLDDSRWLEDSLRQGPFVGEPNMRECEELSWHGYVDAQGLILGTLCSLETDKYNAPVRVTSLGSSDQTHLNESFKLLGQAIAEKLVEAGYFGPFGLDILLKDKTPYLIDLNPRFTLGWSTGMGEKREQTLERALDPRRPNLV